VKLDAGAFLVTDQGSRNRSSLDGRSFTGSQRATHEAVLRAGDTVCLLQHDLRGALHFGMQATGEVVIGPTLHVVWDAIAREATGATLHVTGETGSGKELAARAYHSLGGNPRGPFVAVNCATIPEGVAERLLFGANRGAYSGATNDAEGYVEAADGGTLFLDEIGELEPAVQAKLLRVLETREVLRLGAARARKVDVRLCSATHESLRELVADKRFREDLYFRVARPHVAVPPLRERREEIPYLVARELQPRGALARATLIEACMLRRWPGNVRELRVEIGEAARKAQAASREGALHVTAEHLSSDAGVGFASDAASPTRPADLADLDGHGAHALPEREVILSALREHAGRVATTARALGVHRNQLRRWVAKEGVDPASFGAGDVEGEGED
jgi:transcriptional regulator with PAS, ATPase and Fis domain